MSQPILTTHGLSKRYGRRTVVDAINLTVQAGDIYGFLGPNGAGKTTTLRMVAGLISPSAGAVRLMGHDVARAPRTLMAAVGTLIEGPAFYPHLSAAENIRIVQRLRERVDAKETAGLLELVGLPHLGSMAASRFSLGMKQRLGIAMALVGGPKLLILDEPTNGLDPEGFREIRALLRMLATERGVTVLLSSHLLYEVEQVATRVGVINQGKLLVEAGVEELRRQADRALELEVCRPDLATQLLQDRMGLKVKQGEGRTLLVYGKAQPAHVNALMVHNDLNVSRLVEREASLEEMFFRLTGGTAHA